MSLIGHCQLVVEIGNVFVDLRLEDLLLDLDGPKHHPLRTCVLLLLAQCHSDSLHSV